MIGADLIIPSGKTLSLAGLGIKKYVDKVKLVKTDEHDKRYKIPRVEIHRKQNDNEWKPNRKYNYEDEWKCSM